VWPERCCTVQHTPGHVLLPPRALTTSHGVAYDSPHEKSALLDDSPQPEQENELLRRVSRAPNGSGLTRRSGMLSDAVVRVWPQSSPRMVGSWASA